MLTNDFREETIQIQSLRLNHANPRIDSPMQTSDDQKEIYRQLEKSVGVKQMLSLATSIVKLETVNPLTKICVWKQGNKYIVLDGNRRVACLKLMMGELRSEDPLICDFILENKEKIENALSLMGWKINAIVFEEAEKAKVWIKQIHVISLSGDGALQWSTLQRKIYDNDPVAFLIRDYANKTRIENEKCFPVFTVYERLLRSKIGQKLFKVEWNNEHSKILNPGFLDKVIAGFYTSENRKVTVRDVYDLDSITKLLGKFTDESNKLNKGYLVNDEISFSEDEEIENHFNLLKKNAKSLLKARIIDSGRIIDILNAVSESKLRKHAALIGPSCRIMVEQTIKRFKVPKRGEDEGKKPRGLLEKIEYVFCILEKDNHDVDLEENTYSWQHLKEKKSDFAKQLNSLIHEERQGSLGRSTHELLWNTLNFVSFAWRYIWSKKGANEETKSAQFENG